MKRTFYFMTLVIVFFITFTFDVFAQGIPKPILENKELEVEAKVEKKLPDNITKDIKEVEKENKEKSDELKAAGVSSDLKDVDLSKDSTKEEVIKDGKKAYDLFKEKKYLLGIGALIFLLLSVLRLKAFKGFWSKQKPIIKVLVVSVLGITATILYSIGNGMAMLPAIMEGVFSSSFAIYLHENLGKIFELFKKE